MKRATELGPKATAGHVFHNWGITYCSAPMKLGPIMGLSDNSVRHECNGPQERVLNADLGARQHRIQVILAKQLYDLNRFCTVYPTNIQFLYISTKLFTFPPLACWFKLSFYIPCASRHFFAIFFYISDFKFENAVCLRWFNSNCEIWIWTLQDVVMTSWLPCDHGQ